MAGYIARRCFEGLIILWLLVTAVFIAIRLLPGGPAVLLINPEFLTPESIARVESALGLDRPLHEQYVSYFRALFTGDMGYSYARNAPVVTIIGERLVPTLLLATSTMMLSLVAGVGLGMLSAWKDRGLAGLLLRPLQVFAITIPSFWLGLILIYGLAIQLDWLPAGGMAPPGGTATPDVVAVHLILPTLTLSMNWIGTFAMYTNSSLLTVLRSDYIRTARAKGLGRRITLLRHALPNASFPVLTQAGIAVPHLVGGAIVVEQIFGWPGLGRLTVESLYRHDYPMIVAIVLLTGFFVVVANIVVDVLYRAINPLVRVE